MRRHLTAALLAALALAAPASADTFTVDGARVDVHRPAASARGRVFVLHGLGGTADMLNEPAYVQLRDGLLADRWQVVALDLPYAGFNQATQLRVAFADGGASYLAGWRRHFNQVVAWSNRTYGRARVTGVGGISWGGYNALTVACTNKAVSFWFADMPVVNVTRLFEFADMDVPALSLDSCAPRLARKTGYLGYGLLDERVDWRATARLARLVRRARVNVYPELAHTTTPATNAGLLAWMARR